MPTCPDHKRELEPLHGANVAGGLVLACPVKGCHHARMPPRRPPAALKLPGLDPGRQQNAVHVREEDLQRAIVQALRMKGYEVLITSRVRKRVRCEACGRWSWQAGGDGVTPGCPDLLVWVPERFAWVGIEVKGSSTRVSPSQARLAAEGKVTVVRSVEQAIAAVEAGCSVVT